MRQSGRTTQILMAASECRRHGGTPLIIVHQDSMIRYCMRIAQQHRLSLVYHDFCTPRIALQTRIRGKTQDDVFVDHFVWEEHPTTWDHRTAGFVSPVVLDLYEEIMRLPTRRQRDSERLELEDPWCHCEVHA